MAFHLHIIINPDPDLGPEAPANVPQIVSSATARLLLVWHVDAYGIARARWARD